MRSRRSAAFRKLFEALPRKIQDAARAKYRLFEQDPHHPRLDRKNIERLKGREKTYIRVAIASQYRAVAEVEEDDYLWIFIGKHSDFERFIDRSL